jgi:hypothetical protein
LFYNKICKTQICKYIYSSTECIQGSVWEKTNYSLDRDVEKLLQETIKTSFKVQGALLDYYVAGTTSPHNCSPTTKRHQVKHPKLFSQCIHICQICAQSWHPGLTKPSLSCKHCVHVGWLSCFISPPG